MIYEVFNDLMKNALEQWDYSSVFPPGYAGIVQPIFVPAQIWQIESQIETLTNGGQFTQIIVSLESLPGHDVGTKTFSDVYGAGSAPNTTLKLGSRIRYPFNVTVWVDEQLGGMTTARKMGSQIFGAMFYYRNRLTSIRHINLMHWQEVLESAPQLFTVRLNFEGDVHVTIDV